jgi:small subunit ribosomal protein S17e
MQGDVLGNVKPSFIKNIALDLIEKYPEAFTVDFDNNKQLVQRLTSIESKIMRNRIAGYISRVKEEKKEEKTSENEQTD